MKSSSLLRLSKASNTAIMKFVNLGDIKILYNPIPRKYLFFHQLDRTSP